MSGNVSEWTRSEHRPYPYEARDGRESMGEGASGPRVVRGGAFNHSVDRVRAADRYWHEPFFRSHNLGFRVVVSPFLRRMRKRSMRNPDRP